MADAKAPNPAVTTVAKVRRGLLFLIIGGFVLYFLHSFKTYERRMAIETEQGYKLADLPKNEEPVDIFRGIKSRVIKPWDEKDKIIWHFENQEIPVITTINGVDYPPGFEIDADSAIETLSFRIPEEWQGKSRTRARIIYPNRPSR